MTVIELIEKLKKMPQDKEVWLSYDVMKEGEYPVKYSAKVKNVQLAIWARSKVVGDILTPLDYVANEDRSFYDKEEVVVICEE